MGYGQLEPAAASTKATMSLLMLLPALSFTISYLEAKPQALALNVAVLPAMSTLPLTTADEE
jgi:hypothetical protein